MNRNKGVAKFVICFVVSALMYYFAPREVDYLYCLMSAFLFFIQTYWTLKKDIKKDGLLNFNSVFLFAFFFVSYAFPLLILDTPLQNLFEGIYDYIDYNVSTKCTTLCTLAISVYFCAYEEQRGHMLNYSKFLKVGKIEAIRSIYIVIFAALLIKTVIYMRNSDGIAVDAGFWEVLYYAILSVYLAYNNQNSQVKNVKSFLISNKLALTTSLLLIIIYTFIGDRGLILTCIFLILGTYWFFVKRIHTSFLLVGVIAGVLLMFILQQTRKTDASLGSGNADKFIANAENVISENQSPIMLLSDFLIIHRELYLGYEYYEKKGMSYPSQIFIVPFYPLPFVPSLISQFTYGKTLNDIKAGKILDNYISYTGYGHLGIHCVSDLLMRFGHFGLLFFFYLWGYVVARICSSKKNGVIGAALFLVLLSQALYVPRAPMLDQIKILSDVIILIWIATFFSMKKA